MTSGTPLCTATLFLETETPAHVRLRAVNPASRRNIMDHAHLDLPHGLPLILYPEKVIWGA
jgi:hypothetical protein